MTYYTALFVRQKRRNKMKTISKGLVLICATALLSFSIFAGNVMAKSFEKSVFNCFQEARGGYYNWRESGAKISNEFLNTHDVKIICAGYDYSYDIRQIFQNLCRSFTAKNREGCMNFINKQKKNIQRRCPNIIPIITEHEKIVIKVYEQICTEKKKAKEAEKAKRIEAKRSELERLKGKEIQREKQILKIEEEKRLDEEIRRIKAEKEEAKRVAYQKKLKEERRRQQEKERAEAERYRAQQEEAKQQRVAYAKSKGCKGFYGNIMSFYLDMSVNRIKPMDFIGFMFRAIQPYKVIIKKNHVICYLISPDITFAVEREQGKFYGDTLRQGSELKLIDFGTFGSEQIFIFKEII